MHAFSACRCDRLIRISERGAGRRWARAWIAIRVVVEDDASAQIGISLRAPQMPARSAHGHLEIADRATASAQPSVRDSHPLGQGDARGGDRESVAINWKP